MQTYEIEIAPPYLVGMILDEGRRALIKHYWLTTSETSMGLAKDFCERHGLQVPKAAQDAPDAPIPTIPAVKTLADHQIMLESLAATLVGSRTAPRAFALAQQRARRLLKLAGEKLPTPDPDLENRMLMYAETARR